MGEDEGWIVASLVRVVVGSYEGRAVGDPRVIGMIAVGLPVGTIVIGAIPVG